MKKFIPWLASKCPKREITSNDGQPYLERYFLLRIPLLNITFYLHHFIASDPDRGLHDHPWGWARTIILINGYIELVARNCDKRGHIAIQKHSRTPGNTNLIRGDDYHRVLLHGPNRDAWTLFMHGPRRKGWGFLQLQKTEDIVRADFKGIRSMLAEAYWIEDYILYAHNRHWPKQRWWKKKKT